ncbi:class I SAM-dependent RNA methyltransferase [Treponema sp.]|uniref:THUMP domain-containing class I SAM-dependent RNA methyltransferase n=1 Tax=Treponema sp. TaxID=166 RepID=UPI002A8189AC|nr:class I SAM-dependent RNA methyltransferase [Treponema sp.]MCI6442935.1 class I SAM-dependent RNA methyltransferase [Spirochaetia bacterium]MDY4133565.1 class I SAM-dependent RNA methyltransferase [Treponema sp.]
MTYVALCAVGAEKILGNEIKHLGYSLLDRQAPGRVTFSGDIDAMYRANYCLRTSDRVYIQLAEYKAYNFDELFEGCYKINWQDYLKKTARVIVDKVRVHASKLNSEHSIQSMILKSIYTKLGDVWHMASMPETGESSDVRVYLDKNVATILLDTSGEALHKRGYRTDGGIAPLRETTAAVLLHEMMWRRKTPLHDPFCGSGTIAIEAALYAHNIAPGLGRRFAYENLVIYNQQRALEIKREEASKIRTDVECRITGSDIDPAAVERSRLNAEHACVMAGRALQLIGSDMRIERPDFIQSDYKDIRAPYETGLLLCNPPYGERLLDQADAEDLYGEMKSLFVDFENWQMGVITSQKNFQECICKKASATKTLKAGNLDTTLYIYR